MDDLRRTFAIPFCSLLINFQQDTSQQCTSQINNVTKTWLRYPKTLQRRTIDRIHDNDIIARLDFSIDQPMNEFRINISNWILKSYVECNLLNGEFENNKYKRSNSFDEDSTFKIKLSTVMKISNYCSINIFDGKNIK